MLDNIKSLREKIEVKLKRISLTIRGRLLAGFIAVTILMLGVFGIGYYGLIYVNKASGNVSLGEKEQFLWSNWYADVEATVSNYEYYLLTNNAEWLKDGQDQYATAVSVQKELGGMVDNSPDSSFSVASKDFDNIKKTLDSTVDLQQNGGSFAIGHEIDNMGRTVKTMMTSMNDGLVKSQAATQSLVEAKNKQVIGFTLIMIIIAATAVLIAICISVLIPRTISISINAINRVMKKMATGDLTAKLPAAINADSNDEIGKMARSYNDMRIQLINLVSQLKENAAQLKADSEHLAISARQSGESTQQVAASSQQMAKGAQEQSANAQETAKSIEQLSGVINQLSQGAKEQSSSVQKAIYSITEVSQTLSQVAANAGQAAKGSKQAADVAQLGAEKAKLTLSGMDKIKATSTEVAKKIEELGSHSAEIGKIVAVIDDIAAQTNLLALNAAIEAARAGDQGRGFAVVSDEVRKLAERTSAATKEIADLISRVQKGVTEATQVTIAGGSAVTEGYNMAVQAGQALEQILKASSDVNTQVEQISTKAQQVNQATNELVKVIDSVGSVTEQNTAATEQMTSSATQVSKSVETVAGIAEDNSAATEEVSASAQEMSSQVQDIVASAQTLKEMAATLEQSVAMFKVSEENTTTDKPALEDKKAPEGELKETQPG